DDAPGPAPGDGVDWNTAYHDIHVALRDLSCPEIWVAAGVYKPTTDANRYTSFVIDRDGTQLYGGFAGTESTRAARNPKTNVSVLSGDIDANDTDDDGNQIAEVWTDIQGHNSYQVVTIDGTTAKGNITASTVVDGFTITGGEAFGPPTFGDGNGGGIYCDGSDRRTCSPRLSWLVFSGNRAYQGGALYNNTIGGTSSPELTHITFQGNEAGDGGALYNYAGGDGTSSPTLNHVTFIGNSSYYNGGGIYSYAGSFGHSSPLLTNVTFSGNHAGVDGGAMFNNGSTTFSTSSPVLNHVTFVGNSANRYGGAISNDGYNGEAWPKLHNVILWGQGNGGDIANFFSLVSANDSVIQSGCGGISHCSNVITTDPLLGPLQDNGGPTFTHALLDDSLARDAGNNALAVDPTNSNAPLATDQRGAGFDRSLGGAVDMGAFEAAPLTILSLGDQVWVERNLNGVFDPGVDFAPNGVTVNLYADDGDGVLDAGDGAPIATTTTANIGGQDGRYLFTDLAPGEYIVEVVTSSGPLVGMTSIPGSVDPDNDVDRDDNGDPVAGFGVASRGITLTIGGETLANQDGDGDANTNLTVDFGFEDLVRVSGGVATVRGTDGDDLFLADLATGVVRVNGFAYTLPAGVTSLQFDGGQGNDQLVLEGTPGAETVRLLAGVGLLDSSSVGVTGSAVSMETIVFNGNGGGDVVRFIDSSGDDTFITRPTSSSMRGADYLNIANGVSDVIGIANRGGSDLARLFDGSGDDTFVAQAGGAAMTGAGFSLQAIGFERVAGTASTGNDRAILIGDASGATVVSRPNVFLIETAGTSSEVTGFDRVIARGRSTDDFAQMFGSSGTDALVAGPTSAQMSGTGYIYDLTGFERLTANGGGGNDLVRLTGSAGNDIFSASSSLAQLTGSGFDLRAAGFERMIGVAGAGTGDLAILIDSLGHDSFFGSGNQGDLIGAGFFERAIGFDIIRIRGVNGGINRLALTPPLAYTLVQQGTWV
ncbi:MAG: hypothetical protein KDA75_02685, partial [Planctomycetaceae bacterium]|nr:hypothetical protein [Planctomycetaceae bacterium]